MSGVRSIASALAALLVLYPLVAWGDPVAPSAPGDQLLYEALMKAPVGTYADYLLSSEGEKETLVMHYALVERSDIRLAIEIEVATPEGPFLTRLEYIPDGDTAWKLDHARVKVGKHPVQTVPPPGTSIIRKGTFEGKLLGQEKISTKAGAFDATHYQQGAYEVWMSDRALPLGLVKKVGHSTTEILQKVGSGKKSQLK